MAVKKKSSGGVSLEPDDQVVGGGLFGPGPAVAEEHRWGMFDYNGKRKAVPALLVKFTRDAEEQIESYTCGNGWKPSADGLELIPKAGQTGLNGNCKAALYLAALKDECGMPKGTIGSDISVLDGISGELTRKALEKVEGSDKAGSILVFTELDVAPWIKGSGKKKKASKPTDDDDDAETDDEDDEEEEDEDDAPPAKKKGAAAKGKKKIVVNEADDEEEEDADADEDEDDEDLTEEAGEALLAALEDGPLKATAVEGAVKAQLKGHKQQKAIAAFAANPKFWATEAGWSYDSKKKTLTAD